MTVAALYVRADSVYKSMRHVDAWDAERDARRWPGGRPAIVHPPCAQRANRAPHITKREREATPPQFARWLVDLASRCRPWQ